MQATEGVVRPAGIKGPGIALVVLFYGNHVDEVPLYDF